MGKRLYAKRGMTDAERFWMRVRPEVEGCWEWAGGHTSKAKYGQFCVKGDDGKHRPRYAHRFSYELHYGPIPCGMHVCHKCDNPGCVRPDHLFLGTDKDNHHDSIRKGRRRGVVVTDEAVRAIKLARRNGESRPSIARRFGCSVSTIQSYDEGRIRRGI